MSKLAVSALVLFLAQNSFGMGSKRPGDLTAFTGYFEKVKCAIDSTEPETIPHHIKIEGNSSGQAKLTLETPSKFLTTRIFAVQDTKKTDCFSDSGWTAKCKTKMTEGTLYVKANWDCETYWCTGLTPENYSFKLSSGALTYSEDGSTCEYKRLSSSQE
jgi:hypothetical protein